MRSLSYLALGVVGTLAYLRMQDDPQIGRQMRKMMKNNQKSLRKIREIM
ncbi:hypothetical protein [Haloplasma contractile]|uniref:Uncharacterized protein n=1 Tax=Haloplasma contractile SSD-17B TaxID=1033810 RepID=U2FLT8_9MOLU|nr:hypothetical protein [Haloplasma contractile]ERJ13710.1 hypothetical protein HLPCO_000376 [Haloplasma contractile SSD-17B]